MKTVTISSLRKKIKYYLNLVAESSEVIIVPRPDKDDGIVILSLHEYNALTETSYMLASGANRRRLLESIQQAVQPKEMIPYDPNATPAE